jgi:hypothetical protein
VPFLSHPAAETHQAALVCLLIEHQSRPDPWMPLRVLLYAALYWEREWKAWEAQQARNEPLRLSPVVPVVFHTGPTPWRTHREMAELIGGADELRAFAPRWAPLFWDLAERSADELLATAGEWLAALAVIRAEREDAEAFRRVFTRVLARLERLSEQETVRWHDLVWFVLSWALRRRPGQEREQLLQTARSSQSDVICQEEVRRMSETIEQTWEQELLARGEARGRAEGQMRECRDALRELLEERFGPLPETVVQRIETADNLERLRAARRHALHLNALSELQL